MRHLTVAPLSPQVTPVSKPRPTPAGVIQALPLATPTSSPVSPVRCLFAATMSPVPRQSDSSGWCLGCMADAGVGGLPAGGLEGRACLRKERLSPPLLSSPPPQELGVGSPAWPRMAPPVFPRATSLPCLSVLPTPLQGCHFHQRGHWACEGTGRIACVFPDTRRVTVRNTEPFKADRTV